jgi:hypothetical protein
MKADVEDPDLWHTAAVMVRQHGQDAVLEAAGRSDALRDQRDLTGERKWQRIVGYIKRLEMGMCCHTSALAECLVGKASELKE